MTETGPVQAPQDASTVKKAMVPRPRQPNKKNIHQRPLPVETFPIPSFVPNHPLSIFHIAFVYISQFFFPPISHPRKNYQGYFSGDTRSVHVTDSKTARALWEQGFFGKGSLSRSEPTWLDGEKRRKGLLAAETSEEITLRRREERRQFKLDRAKKEQVLIEQRLQAERQSKAADDVDNTEDLNGPVVAEETQQDNETVVEKAVDIVQTSSKSPTKSPEAAHDEVIDQEHLQLTSEEAFFLAFALGVLTIRSEIDGSPLSISELLSVFRRHSVFPPLPKDTLLLPDDPFLVSYAAYHHFRSLGWVVRSGIKFGVDILLYNRGPVFAHAEFAVLVLPDYSRWPQSQTPSDARRRNKRETRPWWWLHCINRVQTQVRKSTVLAYVTIPAPDEVRELEQKDDVAGILARYGVREIALKRWLPNRSR